MGMDKLWFLTWLEKENEGREQIENNVHVFHLTRWILFSVVLPICLPLSLIPWGRIHDKMKSGPMKMGQQIDPLLSPLKSDQLQILLSGKSWVCDDNNSLLNNRSDHGRNVTHYFFLSFLCCCYCFVLFFFWCFETVLLCLRALAVL